MWEICRKHQNHRVDADRGGVYLSLRPISYYYIIIMYCRCRHRRRRPLSGRYKTYQVQRRPFCRKGLALPTACGGPAGLVRPARAV